MTAIVSTCDFLEYDFIVVGSGVAGLWTATHLARYGRVAVITKAELREGSTAYAQGGIAVALRDDDDPELHLRDTVAAGGGLCDVPAVEILAFDGPDAVRELTELGARFDRDNGDFAFGREAAHSQRRILHADGDATGAEVERALIEATHTTRNVHVYEYTQATHLLVVDGACVGVQAYDLEVGQPVYFVANATAMATGGVGCLYRVTTNPPVATGDGVALAYRAGVHLRDTEFVQFHPTALASPGFPKFLLSEALRGDGARLLNHEGEAFMTRYHKLGDLAPRDEVARAVTQEMEAARQPFVYLDFAPIGRTRVEERFPTIVAECREKGFAVPDEPVPVSPAAHYYMGGIATDVDCGTSLPGLYAVGECSCISVHGANRLASNSLLDGLVFGSRCAQAMSKVGPVSSVKKTQVRRREPRAVDVGAGFYHDLQTIMWDNIGVVRSNASLRNALDGLAICERKVIQTDTPTRHGMEAANALLVAGLIAKAALSRKESRGAHYRSGYEHTSQEFQAHTLVRLGAGGEPEIDYGPVSEGRVRSR
jgi:L-aspartate oxidase